jgi:hypothetical protein
MIWMGEVTKAFVFSIMLLALLFGQPALAYSIDATPTQTAYFEDIVAPGTTPTTTLTPTLTTTTPPTGTTGTTPIMAPVSCNVSELSLKEAKALMALTSEGFAGKNIGDGQKKKPDGIEMDKVELVGESTDGKTAVKQVAPNQAAKADRFTLFAKRAIDGPFGIGIVLNDTLRVGRCEDLEQEGCRTYGNGLSYRTSGKGFKSDLVNAFTSLKDTSGKLALGVSDEEYKKMQNTIFDDDQKNFTVASVEPTDQIQNSFLVQKYTAKPATDCLNSECIVATYSAFDKYYNAWFSTEMVVSSFGPTLLHQSKQLFGFGRRAKSSTFRNKFNEFLEHTRQQWNDIPVEALGRKRIDRYRDTLDEYGLTKIWEEITIKRRAFSTSFAGYKEDLLLPESVIMKLSPAKKKKFFQSLDDFRAYTRVSNTKVKMWEETFNQGISAAAGNKALEKTAQTDFARKLAGEFAYWDDVTGLDYPQWLQESGRLGGITDYTVKRNNTLARTGYVPLVEKGSYNLKGIFTEFSDKGDWSSWANSIDARTFETVATGTNAGKLMLYELDKAGSLIKVGASADDMVQYLGTSGAGAKAIRNNLSGEVRSLNQQNIDLVRNGAWGGNFDLVETAWIPKTAIDPATGAKVQQYLGPEVLAPIISQKRVYGRINTANKNLDDLYYALRENPEFIQRRSWSLLDSQLAKEKDLIQNFYKQPLQTGLPKGTLMPILYWNFKKGAGIESVSAYMLPDTWTAITVSQGEEDIYNDSYIDFYANEGSDQGDMFARAINLPISVYNYIATKFTEENNTIAGDWVTRVTGSSEGIQPEGFLAKAITRDEVQDLVFYSHNENCSGCLGSISYAENNLQLAVSSPVEIEAFVAEAADSKMAGQKGSTIIAYTHHSDLDGKSGQIEGGNINLIKDRDNGETCDQKLRNLGLGWAGNASGLILAGGESMFYVVGLGPGIIGSVIQQTLLTPKIQDCVDDKEGYYIHFYDPPPAKAQKKKTKEVLSSETLSDTVSKMATNLKSSISNTDNPVAKSVGEMTDQFNQFAGQAKKQNILQAKIDLLPPSKGVVKGDEVFYLWTRGNLMPTGLKTEGAMVVTDGDKSFRADYENGDAYVNGKKVIDDKKDIVGLITPDTRGPFAAVPRRINTVSAPNSDEVVFEVNGVGEVFVRQDLVLACILSAIKNQSGITYSGNEISQVFGKLKTINTQGYENIFVRDNAIHLEGSGPRAEGDLASKFIIDGFWNSRLEMSQDKVIDSGKFVGMAFINGSIVLNKETNELVIWLRQHKDAVLTNNEVSGLNAKKTTITDPDTGCEQPAIELEATAFPNDELGQKKVENFNTSMNKMGPFTQFTTDGKVYEFYSVREDSGECKDYFRVIDKETGKILTDKEIVGGITQGADGTLSFQTADGRNHTLEFDAENGVPTLKYNGGATETLRTAQGPNGSFWYDPTSGKWYPENSMQIPLSQAFKDNGMSYGPDGTGNVSGQPVNPMTFNLGPQDGQGFNIPSLPETAAGLALFIAMFLAITFFLTQTDIKRKKK